MPEPILYALHRVERRYVFSKKNVDLPKLPNIMKTVNNSTYLAFAKPKTVIKSFTRTFESKFQPSPKEGLQSSKRLSRQTSLTDSKMILQFWKQNRTHHWLRRNLKIFLDPPEHKYAYHWCESPCQSKVCILQEVERDLIVLTDVNECYCGVCALLNLSVPLLDLVKVEGHTPARITTATR